MRERKQIHVCSYSIEECAENVVLRAHCYRRSATLSRIELRYWQGNGSKEVLLMAWTKNAQMLLQKESSRLVNDTRQTYVTTCISRDDIEDDAETVASKRRLRNHNTL